MARMGAGGSEVMSSVQRFISHKKLPGEGEPHSIQCCRMPAISERSRDADQDVRIMLTSPCTATRVISKHASLACIPLPRASVLLKRRCTPHLSTTRFITNHCGPSRLWVSGWALHIQDLIQWIFLGDICYSS